MLFRNICDLRSKLTPAVGAVITAAWSPAADGATTVTTADTDMAGTAAATITTTIVMLATITEATQLLARVITATGKVRLVGRIGGDEGGPIG